MHDGLGRRRKRRRWRKIGIGAVVAILALPWALAAVAILIGLVAAAFGVVVALAVAIGPWVALGYGGYWLWRRSARNRQMHAAWGAPQPAQPTVGPATGPPPPPAPPPADAAERLPQEEHAQVGRIRRKAMVLLQQADRFPTGSRNLYLVERMLDQYLPSTLDAYLALPPGAAELPITPDRRTGVQVLRGQLDILEAKLDEAAEDLRQVNVDKLLANERFLEEHFGRRSEGELTLPQERDRTA